MGARDLLDDLAGAGFSLTAEADKLVIRPASKLTDDMRAALREAKPELLALLAAEVAATATSALSPNRPYRLALADADAAYAEAWNDGAIARFQARATRFLRLGIDATDAYDLTERLHMRDALQDDRRLRLECLHLTGHASGGRRCESARAAGVVPALPADLVTQLQRCPGFASIPMEQG